MQLEMRSERVRSSFDFEKDFERKSEREFEERKLKKESMKENDCRAPMQFKIEFLADAIWRTDFELH